MCESLLLISLGGFYMVVVIFGLENQCLNSQTILLVVHPVMDAIVIQNGFQLP